MFDPFFLALLAQAYGQSGQAKHALTTIDEALEVMAKTGEKIWHAELHRIKGQLLLESSGENHVEAEDSFQKAIDIARAQNARAWELRAATNLAHLWLDQNKADEARQLLAPIFDWFTEGLETTDLCEAKALLDELSLSVRSKMPRTNF